MTGLLSEFNRAIEKSPEAQREMSRLKEECIKLGLTGAGALASEAMGYSPERMKEVVEDRVIDPAMFFLEEYKPDPVPTGIDPNIKLNYMNPLESYATPTVDLSKFLNVPGLVGEAGATVNMDGVSNPFIRADVPIYNGIVANVEANQDGSTIGARYGTDVLGGRFEANVQSERTSGVRDFLNNFTAGLRFTMEF